MLNWGVGLLSGIKRDVIKTRKDNWKFRMYYMIRAYGQLIYTSDFLPIGIRKKVLIGKRLLYFRNGF